MRRQVKRSVLTNALRSATTRYRENAGYLRNTGEYKLADQFDYQANEANAIAGWLDDGDTVTFTDE